MLSDAIVLVLQGIALIWLGLLLVTVTQVTHDLKEKAAFFVLTTIPFALILADVLRG
jgi:hypothetical protein